MAHNKISILGPQGSGKGTQAQILAKLLNVPHISTGTIFRKLKKEKSAKNKPILRLLNQGKLIPDQYTNQIIQQRLSQKDCSKGFVLDGYPRNETQAKFLIKYIKLDCAIVLNLSNSICLDRITGRTICAKGHSYHTKFKPPKKKGICDIDNLPLFRRQDETKKALQQRLSIYRNKTQPAIKKLGKNGIKVILIDGKPAIHKITQNIKKKLGI